jgi:hypothetical protein
MTENDIPSKKSLKVSSITILISGKGFFKSKFALIKKVTTY